MPFCNKCGRYDSSAEMRRLPNRNDPSILTYHCKDRFACRARSASSYRKGEEPRSSARPAGDPKEAA